MKSQWKAIVDSFQRGRQYERLEGQEGRKLSATEMNSEKLPAQGGRVTGSEIVPNWHVFLSILG